METERAGEDLLRVGEKLGNWKAYCKCGEGWSCVITKTQGPDAGKTFVNCGQNCLCIIEGKEDEEDIKVEQDVDEKSGGSKAFCKCGEGWSCVISRIEDTNSAKKSFFECAGDCTCVTTA